ncbi:MAG TPA: tetratricopeptide repeat protein [Candidatus Polarisedimenticolaceae bacterium]|nr:tetratricopeptide repeat protein [Candidatus Polarisedimenticolaceae bacterium]
MSRRIASCALLGWAALAPALAQEAPSPAPEKKEGFFRRLWPRQDAVPTEPAPAPTGAPGAASAPAAPTAAAVPPAPVPRRLAVVQERLRATRVGTDLTGLRYLDLVDSGTATPAQLNAFGVWLAGQGILEPAQEYFRASLDMNREDAEVWNNLGMVQLRLDQDGAAKSSFERAIALDPTHARAHYNLGMYLDDQGDYDGAIQEYTRALLLDPRLGDAAYNPQVVNNPRILVVRMGLYERKAKTVGLSMGQTAPPAK